jgi:hypothetical protein
MLEPINRVGGHLQLSTRFMLTDVLALMVLLQVPLAIVGRAIDTGSDRDNSPYWLLLSVGVLLVGVLWAAAVSVVSRAGIVRLWPRLCVIVLLVPGTLAVMILGPLGILAVFLSATSFQENPMPTVLAGLLLLALAGAAAIIRMLSFWSLRDSPGESALAAIMGGQASKPATKMLAHGSLDPSPADRQQ